MTTLFRTPIPIDPAPFRLDYETPVLFMGSCFTGHLGQWLADHKFPVLINPFGIVYNPASMVDQMQRLLDPVPFGVADLQQRGGQWFSYAHHGQFGDADPEALCGRLNAELETSAAFLRQSKVWAMTFGTAWVYRLKETGRVVANCHKQPDGMFARERLTVVAITTAWRRLIETALLRQPDLKLIFTVSPVRHGRDGALANQRSKAILLLAAEALTEAYPNAVYFPAYEVLMDELRDYRFYAEDMLHPAPVAIGYIREQFLKAFLADNARATLQDVQRIQQAVNHRPLHPESEAHQKFVVATCAKITRLEALGLDFGAERARLTSNGHGYEKTL